MTDCCSAPGLLSFECALAAVLDMIEPISSTETIALTDAAGRVLALDITSPINVPPHNNSAMDGYAFAHSSLQDNRQLTLVGKAMAGAPYQGVCPAGSCIRIMTGAKLPAGCDTVEMQENCQLDGNVVSFLTERRLGDNVRYAGEDIKQQQQVFQKGRQLTSIDIGVLASLGIDKLTVVRPLTVALIATGDELKHPGELLAEGDIYESNHHVLSALLKQLNFKVIDFGIIPDNIDAITAAFVEADQQADAVISSGGVSVGDADYTKMVLDQLGEIAFWKIAMKPGKPFAFGRLPNSYFFGLPGNPVSAVVTAHLLAMPGLMKLQSRAVNPPMVVKAKLQSSLKKSPGRKDFQRGILATNSDGELVVDSTGKQGSGILTSMSAANCYIVLAAEQGSMEKNSLVDVQLFEPWFSL